MIHTYVENVKEKWNQKRGLPIWTNKMIEFENPFEDNYEEFFKRYFDLTDKMIEFMEK